MRVALDTNIIAYAEGIEAGPKRQIARDLIVRVGPENVVLPVQTLGELFNVLIRKGGRSRDGARLAVLKWRDGFSLVETSVSVMLAAAALAVDHQLAIWDSVILSAASHADCRLLLSEDMQDGFTWNSVTVANPFAAPRHPLLEALFASGTRQ